MADLRLEKLARLLVEYSVKVKPNDTVVVRGNMVAEPLMREVVRHVTRAGGFPIISMSSDGISEAFWSEANEDQVKFLPPGERFFREEADVVISLGGGENTRTLTGIDPEMQKMAGIARTELSQAFMQRSADKKVRWTIAMFPNQSMAQEADMSLSAYEDFVYGATYCDQDDPVAEWQKIHDMQQEVIDWLKGRDVVTVKSPNADLTLSIKDRVFINSDGAKNMPSGEVFTGPVENSANGWVNYTYPAIRGGREVDGIRLEFKDGKVVKATAEKNEEYLLSQLESDEGAKYLGEFAIGTNYGIQEFTKSILFDEKIGGTFHMALGAGYPETGSTNRSAIHWDMICDVREDSEIRVDGDLLYKDGEFQI